VFAYADKGHLKVKFALTLSANPSKLTTLMTLNVEPIQDFIR